MRGREVSRIEGFSDAVFGFALTLLVVSLEVPQTFADLERTLSGFLPFAATFAVVCWIWYEHYAFFRKFGPEDALTVALNCALLFVVLFFAYPLKFVSTILAAQLMEPGAPNTGFGAISRTEARTLMLVYCAGFIAVFTAFAALYWNAYSRRVALDLSALETFDARVGIRTHLLSVSVGALAAALSVVVPQGLLWLPGTSLFLLGPVHGINGHLRGRARERLEAQLSSIPAPP